jgi:Tfp pilus assembly PilM family ATPase/Tfp pilus assembly protein PilN
MTHTAVIEIKADSLRIVVSDQVKPGGALRIIHAATVPYSPEATSAERGQALGAALKAAGIEGGAASIIVPRSQANCRKALLPSSDPTELASMARFEAERHLPLNAERHIVEHALLGKPAVEGTEVLVAALDEPVALEVLETATAAGLDVASIGISTLALFRAWLRSRGGASSAGDQGPSLLIHLDEDSVELVLVAGGQPAYNRSAPVGLTRLIADVAQAGPQPMTRELLGQLDALEPHRYFLSAQGLDPAAAANEPQGAAARAWLLRLLREIRQTVDFARREAAAPSPDTVYLSGAGAGIRHIAEFITTNTGATVEEWNPFGGFEIAPSNPLQSAQDRLAFAACAGGFLQPPSGAPYPNLIPARYIAARREKQKKRNLIILGIQVAAFLILAYGLVAQRINHMRETTEALSEANQSLSTVAAELQAKQTRNQIVRNYIRGNSSPVAILDQISLFDIIPEKVTLTRFEYKKDEYVKVIGHARDIQAVNAMESSLRQTGLFTKVSQDQGSNAPVQLPNRGKDGTVLQYSMTCEFAKPGSREARRPAGAVVETQ